jgi:hypothetical protein
MMAIERLAKKQRELKKKQKPHRGRQARVPILTSEDHRLMLALILLRQGWSVSLVAIHPQVQLPVDRIRLCYDALIAGSATTSEQ